eukprot:scaffold8184_cov134-Isochrysis_galbana.AAC.1
MGDQWERGGGVTGRYWTEVSRRVAASLVCPALLMLVTVWHACQRPCREGTRARYLAMPSPSRTRNFHKPSSPPERGLSRRILNKFGARAERGPRLGEDLRVSGPKTEEQIGGDDQGEGGALPDRRGRPEALDRHVGERCLGKCPDGKGGGRGHVPECARGGRAGKQKHRVPADLGCGPSEQGEPGGQGSGCEGHGHRGDQESRVVQDDPHGQIALCHPERYLKRLERADDLETNCGAQQRGAGRGGGPAAGPR